MKFALSLIALIIAALIIPFLMPGAGQEKGADHTRNLPWQIVVDGQGGSEVFGVRLGQSNLHALRQQLGDDLEVAIIAAPDELGSLEAYFAQAKLGFVLARVIVTVDVSQKVIFEMRERALKAQHMESTTRKITLSPDDRAQVMSLPIKAISVIPTVNLDEATVTQRFGPPGERLPVSEKRVHLLYPSLGLDVIVDAEGKELLQYVAPRDFALLRDPLLAVKDGK